MSHDVVPALIANALLPPYTTIAGEDGATVNMTSAITLVNRLVLIASLNHSEELSNHCNHLTNDQIIVNEKYLVCTQATRYVPSQF